MKLNQSEQKMQDCTLPDRGWGTELISKEVYDENCKVYMGKTIEIPDSLFLKFEKKPNMERRYDVAKVPYTPPINESLWNAIGQRVLQKRTIDLDEAEKFWDNLPAGMHTNPKYQIKIPDSVFLKIDKRRSTMQPVSFEFVNNVIESRIEKIRNLCSTKGSEYATEADRLHNFTTAAQRRSASTGKHVTREDAIMWFAEKHAVSIEDVVNKTNRGEVVSEVMISEKVGDMIVYLCLLEASLYATQQEVRRMKSSD